METFIVLLIVILIPFAIYKSNKNDYNNQVQSIKDRDLLFTKQANRQLLSKVGEEKFAKYFGEDQLKLIKENNDTQSVQMKKIYSSKI